MFPTTERAVLELPVEFLLRREYLIDDAGELERHQRAGDPERLAPGLGLEEGADFRVVLDRAEARVTERQLEVAVARRGAGAMPGPAARIVGARDEATIGEALPTEGKRVMPSISV